MKCWFCNECKDRRCTDDTIVMAFCGYCTEKMLQITDAREIKAHGFIAETIVVREIFYG